MPLLSRHHRRCPQCPCLGWYYKLCGCVRGEMNYYTRSYENKNKQIISPKLVWNIFINIIYILVYLDGVPLAVPPSLHANPSFGASHNIGWWEDGGVVFRSKGWVGFLGGLAQLVEEGMSYFKSWARSPNVVLLISYLDWFLHQYFICADTHTHTQIDRQTDKIG